MKASTLPTMLSALGRADSSGSPDALLLELFTADNDQDAFSQLVHRYARLVWRVARTRCRTEATAEDVFQATFVVLAKKAGSILSAGALAGWLHRTAHRLAVKATRAENKAKPDRSPQVQSNPLDELSARELLATIDDELAKLTDAERSVLILCGVDGEPLDDVATRLCCSAMVVKGRLQRARAKLRSRLEARGLTLPAVLLGLFAAPTLSTIQAAVHAATSTTYSLAVSTLIAEGITMKAMTLKATLALALCGMIAMVGGGSGGSPNPSPNAIAATLPNTINAPLPKPKPPEGVIVLSSFGEKKKIELFKPDGESLKVFEPKGNVINAKLAPDGKRIAFFDYKPNAGAVNRSWSVLDFCWFDVEAEGLEVQKIAENISGGASNAWSVDGQTVYYSQLDPEKYDESTKPGALLQYRSYAFNFKTKKATELKLPGEQMILEVTPDGKSLLTSSQCNGVATRSLFLTPLDTCKPQLLIKDEVGSAHTRFSPDGKRLLLSRVGMIVAGDKDKGPSVYLLDLATKKEHKIQLPDETKDSTQFNACFSPDGKRLAIHWYEKIPQPRGAPVPVGPGPAGKPIWLASRVTVCDIDGGNAKMIISKEYNESVTGIDWAPVRLPEEKEKADREINAPLPKTLKKQASAWGEEVEGLQAELRMLSGTTVEPGRSPELQVVVRNISKKAINIEYTDQVLGVYVGGESVDGKVELHWSVFINGNMPKALVKTLEPGEELIRWKLQVRHTPKADAEPYGVSYVDLPAGAYKFVMKQVGGDLMPFTKTKSSLDQLGTGSLEVNLLEPTRGNISAPLPKAKFEWKEGKGIEFKSSPYGDRITGIAHSPDGKFIAVAVGEQVHLLDATTQKPVNKHALTAKAPGTITSVAFSPKGDKLAMTAKDFVFLYSELGKSPSVSSDSSWKTPGFDAHQVAWLQNEDGKERLIATNGEESRFRDPEGKEQIYPWLPDCRHRPSIIAAVPGRDAWLMSHDNGKKLPEHAFWYWSADAEKGRRLLVGHKARPTSAVVSADGNRIVSADEGGTLIVWEGERFEFKETSRIELGEGVAQLALAPDGKTLAVVRTVPVKGTEVKGGWRFVEPELHMFDVTKPPAKSKPLWTTKIGQDSWKIDGPVSLAFSPHSNKLLAAFGDPYNSGLYDKGVRHTGLIPSSIGIKVWELVLQK